MIAACPKCEAKYRVDEAKVGPEGARLRCARCQAVFRVRAPGSAPAPPRPAAKPRPAASPQAPTVVDTETTAPEEPSYDRSRLVLVADPKVETGKQVVGALTSWGMQTILVHDGVEAMLTIQRTLPRLVILDAALPKMYGFQVCEVVKRNESLRDTRVVLVGAIHNRDRYRRPPSELYGADCYLEQPDLPDGLLPLLERFGMAVSKGAAAPAAPVPRPAPEPQRAPHESPTLPATPVPVAPASRPTAASPKPVAPAAKPVAPPPKPVAPAPKPAAADDGLAEEREKAERLARIVVSDIVLYQGEKFDQAIRAGNLLEALDGEIEEGRGFFRQRIDERVRNEKDHIVEELLRVAHQRGMQ